MSYFSIFRSTNLPASAGSYSVLDLSVIRYVIRGAFVVRLFPFAVAPPHNIFFYENFFVAMIASRRSGRDESELSNPLKPVEAEH